MARTTAGAVQKILLGDYGKGRDGKLPSLDPFIEAASSLVDDVVECATEKGVTLSTAKRELLERWLAAHFYQQSDKGYSGRSTERSSGQFHGQWGMRLENTNYGQTAMTLDPSGCLAEINSSTPQADLFWGGTTDTNALDYDERN